GLRTFAALSLLRFVPYVLLALVIAWGIIRVRVRHANDLVEQLLAHETPEVQGIMDEMNGYRRWVEGPLREAEQKAERDEQEAPTEWEKRLARRQRLHAALALLPTNPDRVSYLKDRLLDAEPQELAVMIELLARHGHDKELKEPLWEVVLKPPQGQEGQRLRAACALASFDPDNARWEQTARLVVKQLVGADV